MLKKIRAYFFTGLLVLLPIIGTVGIIYWIFIVVTNFLINPMQSYFPENIKPVIIRFASLLVAFIIVVFIGMLGKIVFLKKIARPVENLLARIPLFNKIYNTFKQISSAIWESQATILKNVVLLEYPRKGVWSIGFTTSHGPSKVSDILKYKMIGVFITTTPNPTTGIFVFVAKKDLIFLSMSVEEGLKLVVSGGTIEPSEIKKIDKK